MKRGCIDPFEVLSLGLHEDSDRGPGRMRGNREPSQEQMIWRDGQWSLKLESEVLGSNGRIDECRHGLAAEKEHQMCGERHYLSSVGF